MDHQSFVTRAQQIQRRYAAAVERIAGDVGLSVVGRQQGIAKADGERLAAVRALQEEYRAAAAGALAGIEKQVSELMRSEAERIRRLVGDQVYAELVRVRVDAMDADEVVSAFENAPTEYDAELIRQFGLVRLAGDGTVAAHIARNTLTSDIDRRVNALRVQVADYSDEAVARLDIKAFGSERGARLGVSPNVMVDVMTAAVEG